ncbi:MAG: FAD-dependent oxidoreductase [Acidobacteria bacterium]|nr:FAD-dependent oxidoreductase [Acidobacteriota bacterium]
MKRNEKKDLSRRDFIKTTAVGVGATALTGLSAKEAKAQGPPVNWDKETDVVVVGTGCGLGAAIEAKRAGADVLIVEKADHVGGLWIMAGGGSTMGGGTILQQRAGVQDTVEQWYQDEMYSNQYRGVPEIMRTLCGRGPDTVLWLENLGLKWATLGAGALRPPIRRGHSPDLNLAYLGIQPGTGRLSGGIAWTAVMHNECDKLGIPILLNHRMTRIHRPDMNGPVLGIEVETPQGTINIKARKGVVLATGGWTDNPRMCQAWDPRIVGPDTYGDGGVPGQPPFVESAGDGHLAAAEIGAGFSDMSFVAYLYIYYGTRAYNGWDPLDWKTQGRQGNSGLHLYNVVNGFQRVILVKNDGARWINEAEAARTGPRGLGGYSENPEWPYPATYLSLPQPRNVWCVTDADGAAALNWTVDMFTNPNPKAGFCLDPEYLAMADALQQLASKMGINATNLEATLSKYNGFVDAGVDTDFGKPMPLYKIAKPPFFAGKASLIRHTQRNGLRVNTKSQVLEQSDQRLGETASSIDAEKVIPHLYAAGEVGNSLGWRRVHNSLGHYLTAALIAGENAAKETSL